MENSEHGQSEEEISSEDENPNPYLDNSLSLPNMLEELSIKNRLSSAESLLINPVARKLSNDYQMENEIINS